MEGLEAAGIGLSALNRRFSSFLSTLDPAAGPELAAAAALVSRRVEEGHICLDLADEGLRAQWESPLRSSPLVGGPGDFAPLILDAAGRLYLYRYWAYEATVARFVRERSAAPPEPPCAATLDEGLARYFPGDEDDGQRAAARAALLRPFLVISGGPGTGKTSTVVKILALLLDQPGADRLRVALAAPTGKAAARLKDSLRKARSRLPAPPAVLARIPTEVSTLHRLLGTIRGTSRFRHDAENPLPFDVVVVDEASMVDLPLMAKLVIALPTSARLLLLGDSDQLASVEPGAVLGDLCGRGLATPIEPGGPSGSVVRLDRSYRFGEQSGIGAVGRAVNSGDPGALNLLASTDFEDVRWVPLGEPGGGSPDLATRIVRGSAAFLTASTPEEAFDAFGRFQILCALRRGPFGVEAVNERAQRALAAAGLLRLPRGSGVWYRGRPVLVTVNDYAAGLFNGDVGIALPDPSSGGELRVFFPSSDGFRTVPPARMPQHETAFALTVHKSQGSEFDEVLLLLGDRPAPVLTRELIYTGLTRAKGRAEVWGTPAVFREAVARRLTRSSGLRDAIWGADTAPSPTHAP